MSMEIHGESSAQSPLYGGQSPTPTPATPEENPVLKAKIATIGDHCLQTMKLLDSQEKRLLMGNTPDPKDLAPVADEIQMLKEVLAEHRSEAGENPVLSPLLQQAEVRVHALELKLGTLQSYGETARPKAGELFHTVVEEGWMKVPAQRHFKATVKSAEGSPISQRIFAQIILKQDAANIEPTSNEKAHFLSVSPGGSSRYPGAGKLGKEISQTATHVLKVQKYLEEADPRDALKAADVIDQHTVDQLHSRIAALESALTKAAVRWPDARLTKQLGAQISLLQAKLHTVEAYRQALKDQPQT